MRTAREVVEAYNFEVWNRRDYALAEELLGDTVVRHDVGEVVTLTREQARHRIERVCAEVGDVQFSLPVVVAGDDGELVAIVYQAEITTQEGSPDPIASIEVFRVVDGRIVEVWNNTHQKGRWA